MHDAGMAATLKHFPGHGTVREDTHFDDAVDNRTLDEIRANDLVPFAAGIEAGADAVMLAHVAYRRWHRSRRAIVVLDQRCAARGNGIPRRVFSTTSAWPRRTSAGGVKAASTRTWTPAATCAGLPSAMVEESLAAVEGRALNTRRSSD